jgi:hypothetical protein
VVILFLFGYIIKKCPRSYVRSKLILIFSELWSRVSISDQDTQSDQRLRMGWHSVQKVDPLSKHVVFETQIFGANELSYISFYYDKKEKNRIQIRRPGFEP